MNRNYRAPTCLHVTHITRWGVKNPAHFKGLSHRQRTRADAGRQKEWGRLGVFFSSIPILLLTYQSMCRYSPMDRMCLTPGWVQPARSRREWSSGFFLLQCCRLAVCISRRRQLFSPGIPHRTTFSGFEPPLLPVIEGNGSLLAAHAYWTISGLFPETYSWQTVSFKNSPQMSRWDPDLCIYNTLFDLNNYLWHTLGTSCYFYVWNIPVAFHCTWNIAQIVWCAKPYWSDSCLLLWADLLAGSLPSTALSHFKIRHCFVSWDSHPKDLPAYNSNFSLNVISVFLEPLNQSSHPNTIITSYINFSVEIITYWFFFVIFISIKFIIYQLSICLSNIYLSIILLSPSFLECKIYDNWLLMFVNSK